ncbi:hypothetical protein SLS62_010196 [Diatrype stigma]|uniref:Capsule polysaccharide biosynthesis protein n=1 Tax=Diatrype stigma TaxID=117547 RepID=A0AAN9UCH9_9PEZI
MATRIIGSSTLPTTTDARTDEEILAELQTYRPVDPNSERNIWAFLTFGGPQWDKGLAAAKPWCQRNITSWVRRHAIRGTGWTVRVLDMVPGSANHFSRFVPEDTAEFFPQAFRRYSHSDSDSDGVNAEKSGGKGLTGTHRAPHAADLLRLPLLYLHGGVWLDVGFTLFRDLDDLCWDALADPGSPLELAGFRMTISDEIAMFWNGFIAARRGCVAVRHWHDLFLKLWEGGQGASEGGNGGGGNKGGGKGGRAATTTEGMAADPLLRHLPRYEVPSSTGEPPAFAYADYVDYLIQMFCLERLRHTRDAALGWDGPAWFAQKVLLYECVTEVYWAQALTHWDGRKQFEMLSRKRREGEGEGEDGRVGEVEHPEDEDEGYREARAFVDGILETSSTMKLSHGLVTEQREYLARIWDQPDHADADREPGTFAAYLRWASVHYQQTRELKPLLLPVREDALLTGGLFDAVGTPHPHWGNEKAT